MALEASHIRIALAVKDNFEIADVGAYLRGTIYPDSRYITSIARLLTHPEDYRKDPAFMKNDFYKGWLIHLLCDDIQYQATKETFPSVCEGKEGPGSDVWILRTAIKIIQDMNDARNFDVVSMLSHFNQPFAPNRENIKLLEQYYEICAHMYQNPEKLSLENSYAPFWSAFGLDEDTKMRLIQQTHVYLEDPEIKSKAEGLYGIIVKRIEIELPQI